MKAQSSLRSKMNPRQKNGVTASQQSHFLTCSSLILVFALFFEAPFAHGNVLIVDAEIHKQAFDQSGKVFLDVWSKCSVGIDTNSDASFCRYIRWEDGSNSWQEYWIGAGRQQGILVVSAAPPAGAANLLIKQSGPDGNPENSTSAPFLSQSQPKYATVTNAVVAHDVQPRWSSDEVQSVGLALLDSNLVACAFEQGGLLPPWMEGSRKDQACSSSEVHYGAVSDWPEKVEFRWDEAAWRKQLAELGVENAKSVKATRPDGTVLFRLSVVDWLDVAGRKVPAKWRTDLYSPRPILPLYLLQSISFNMTNFTWAERFPEPEIPAGIALHDCRSSNPQQRGLTVIYVSAETNATIAETSPTYRTLVADARFYNDNEMRQDLGAKTLNRKGEPWQTAPPHRRIVIWILLLPPLMFLFGLWYLRKRQARLENV